MTNILKARMIALLEQDHKREYLELCKQQYAEAVEVSRELFPGYYNKAPEEMALSESLYSKAMEMKKLGNVEGEIRILESTIQSGIDLPACYERLAILYSKEGNYKQAYEVCLKWFDSVFWKLPQTSTSSLRLLDRLAKLTKKVNISQD
jgi:tetratricopeptide (TPR) repeat protein